jgi:hypothetical protein
MINFKGFHGLTMRFKVRNTLVFFEFNEKEKCHHVTIYNMDDMDY